MLREQDLKPAMQRLAAESARLLGVRLVAVGVPDEFAGVVRYDVVEGAAAGDFDRSPVDINDSFAGSVMLAGVAIHVDGRDPAALAGFTTAQRFVGHDVIAQPVLVGDEPVAVLIAVDRESGAPFGTDEPRSCSRRSRASLRSP